MQIEAVRREKETEIQDRNEMIAHLKDQLQEMKAKSSMEGKYVKKCSEVSVAQTQKKCSIKERELTKEAKVIEKFISWATYITIFAVIVINFYFLCSLNVLVICEALYCRICKIQLMMKIG